jgi:hypothetical protein
MFSWIVSGQHTFYIVIPLEQYSVGRHVAPLRHIILNPSKTVFALVFLFVFFLLLRAKRRNSRYQWFSLWFNLTAVWTLSLFFWPGFELTSYRIRIKHAVVLTKYDITYNAFISIELWGKHWVGLKTSRLQGEGFYIFSMVSNHIVDNNLWLNHKI